MDESDVKPGDLIYLDGHLVYITAELQSIYLSLRSTDDAVYHINNISTKKSIEQDLRRDHLIALHVIEQGKYIGNIKDLVKLIEDETDG